MTAGFFENVGARAETLESSTNERWKNTKEKLKNFAKKVGGIVFKSPFYAAALTIESGKAGATGTVRAAEQTAAGVKAGGRYVDKTIDATTNYMDKGVDGLKSYTNEQKANIIAGGEKALEYGKTKKEQLGNLADSTKGALVSRYERIKAKAVSRAREIVMNVQAKYESWKAQKAVAELTAQLQNVEAAINFMKQRHEELSAQREKILQALGKFSGFEAVEAQAAV